MKSPKAVTSGYSGLFLNELSQLLPNIIQSVVDMSLESGMETLSAYETRDGKFGRYAA